MPELRVPSLLLTEQRDKEYGTRLWFYPRHAVQGFGLSEDTCSAGIHQLELAGVVTAQRQPINRD